MRNVTLEVGKIYGGMKITEIIPGHSFITVQCMRCGYICKRERDIIRTKLVMSCGGFGCKERSKSFNPRKVSV